MHAAVVRAFGDPPEIAIERRPAPVPGPGEVRIAVEAVAVSFVDALIAAGRYQHRPELPWIPGSECAGRIDAIGPCVDALAVGDRVCALGWSGVTAERLCAPAADVLPVPATIPSGAAAALRVSYTTAWHALIDRAAAVAGERLLVLGAGGAVGSAAVAVGRRLGLEVTAASRETLSGTHDIVFDPVGGEAATAALARLAPGGRYCVIGFAAGEVPGVRFNRLLLGETVLIGVSVGAFTAREPARARANAERIVELVAEGALPLPAIAHRFALDRAAEAFALARQGRGGGRILIEV